MLTRDAFTEHKQEYTVFRKHTHLDHYRNEANTFDAGGTIYTMFTPVSDEASIQTFGEKVSTMKQAVIYDDTEMEAHDQIEIDGETFEIITIQKYPSYRLIRVNKI